MLGVTVAHRQRAPKYTHSYIDSCAFDPGGVEEQCSRRLHVLPDSGQIVLEIAHSVQKEVDHPNTPEDVKRLARRLIYTIETDLTQQQLARREEIRSLIRGNAAKGKHEDDADHIFDLDQNGGGYLITTDRRLLSRSEDLFEKCFVTTITPCEYEKLL